MARAQCPKCHGTGSVVSHLNPHDANKVGAGMGMHRCDRCAGQGVIHTGLGGGAAGGFPGSAGGSLGERVGNLVIWIFAIFFAIVFANAPLFGLNWVVSGFIGLLFGAAVAGALLAFRIGRYILWALGLGFIALVIVMGIIEK
jgi:hypothetical protein